MERSNVKYIYLDNRLRLCLKCLDLAIIDTNKFLDLTIIDSVQAMVDVP
jgi:hypothetical protein